MPNKRVQEVSRLLHRKQHHTQENKWESGMVKRVREQKIVTSSANLQVEHTAKTKQAFRYAGYKIQRAPGIMLNGTRYTDPKDPGEARRKQESNFVITINTNKSPKDGDYDTCTGAMWKMLQKLAEEQMLASYIKFGPVSPEYLDDKYSDVIIDFNFRANVETGDQMKRVHAHIYLTVNHYSQIQINANMLQFLSREAYNEALPVNSSLRIKGKPHVHVKLLFQSNWNDIYKQYLMKGMQQV